MGIYLRKRSDMSKRFRFSAGTSILLLFALCACGDTTSTGTSSGGPVTISTDHTTYQPSNAIVVSVANHLPMSIFAYDTRASCSILGLQTQTNNAWRDTSVARCSLGRPAILVEIPAGKVYTATITAGSPPINQTTFPAGNYRLVLTYSTSATQGPQSNANTTTLYSAIFMVTT